jgi:hypothetical protein
MRREEVRRYNHLVPDWNHKGLADGSRAIAGPWCVHSGPVFVGTCHHQKRSFHLEEEKEIGEDGEIKGGRDEKTYASNNIK